MTAQLDIAALTKVMTDSMVKHFTTEELKALADFYGSPIGKSAMQKFGGLYGESRNHESASEVEPVAPKSIAVLESTYSGTSSHECGMKQCRFTAAK
jgi:Uncharacterized protein conserved in bacteria (DUF2059)